MEAGGDYQCWLEVGNERAARHRICLRPGGSLGCATISSVLPPQKLTAPWSSLAAVLEDAIIKDQAFFFGAYEGQRYNVGNSYKQFRAEFFNIFNHPNFANPYGGQNGFGLNDPSVQPFGCGCATPDVAAANPVIGSGGSRAVQLALKFTFLELEGRNIALRRSLLRLSRQRRESW
jgi:hypothetical protein